MPACSRQRYISASPPSYLKKMASADKEITVLSLADMDDTDEQHYGLNGSPTQVRRIFPPSSDARHEYWDDDSDTVTEPAVRHVERTKIYLGGEYGRINH